MLTSPRRHRDLGAAAGLVLGVIVLTVFASVARPRIEPGVIPGPNPDAADYAHMAASLLHGTHLVDYDGAPHPTRYTPGFPFLLTPAVALGGLEAAVWVPYAMALLLGCMALLIATRLGGGVAGPLAVLLTLFTPAGVLSAHMVMSDLPSAALALGEVALLAFGLGRTSAGAAGLIAGVLVWMRPSALILGAAGCAGLTASGARRERVRWYLAGLVVLAVLLGLWQWSVFGSPLTTSYQAASASPGGSAVVEGFYSLRYVFGPPWNSYAVGLAPNAVAYPASLLGFDSTIAYPGAGLLGLVGAVVVARSTGPGAVVGRFSIVANVVTLLAYLPYFFRDERFLMIPAALNGVTAALVIAWAFSWLRSLLPSTRSTRLVPPVNRSNT